MRILIVDDEARLADSVARGLLADGIDADIATDGYDGLWRAREGTYDAIVLDVMLPGLNGFQVCRQLRADEVWTPILMLTAKDGEYDEAESLDLGADDYLRKPCSHVVLSARLRALARRVPSPRPALLTAGDLLLDPATRAARRGSTPIELTSREFAVLEALLRRAPEVVAKDELLRTVWGMDFDGDPNIVEVYVGYLRRKVDRPFGRESLRTVRGAGYRVVPE
jgi:DNA-binding response OmpR family regulator